MAEEFTSFLADAKKSPIEDKINAKLLKGVVCSVLFVRIRVTNRDRDKLILELI